MRTSSALVLAGLVAAACVGCSDPQEGTGPGTDVPGCGGAITVAVADADGLRAALEGAGPGDVIALADGRYAGPFVVRTSGTENEPATLCGSAEAVLDGGPVDGGYTLHLDGAAHWRLRGFSLTGGQKGLMLDAASYNEVDGLRITGTGDEALHLRTGSSHNRVTGVRIRDTGLREPEFGEGIYVGSAESNWCDLTGCEPDRSDHNELVGNDVGATSAEAVDVKEGTTGGVLRDNVLTAPTGDVDSVVDLKGTGWQARSNDVRAGGLDGFAVLVLLAGWGRENQVVANSVTLTGDGYAVRLVGEAEGAGNVVGCGQGLRGENSNVACG